MKILTFLYVTVLYYIQTTNSPYDLFYVFDNSDTFTLYLDITLVNICCDCPVLCVW